MTTDFALVSSVRTLVLVICRQVFCTTKNHFKALWTSLATGLRRSVRCSAIRLVCFLFVSMTISTLIRDGCEKRTTFRKLKF